MTAYQHNPLPLLCQAGNQLQHSSFVMAEAISACSGPVDTPRQPGKPESTTGEQEACQCSMLDALWQLVAYYAALWHFLVADGAYASCPVFQHDTAARAQVYSLALELYLWDRPHYRSGTWQGDSLKNLRNVALPGTGVPLAWLATSRLTALAFLLLGYPLLALLSALVTARWTAPTAVAGAFVQQLLRPRDWFSLWRLNCRLASAHAHLTQAPGYAMENKWDFLLAAKAAGVPVSPWLGACADCPQTSAVAYTPAPPPPQTCPRRWWPRTETKRAAWASTFLTMLPTVGGGSCSAAWPTQRPWPSSYRPAPPCPPSASSPHHGAA